MLRRITRIFRKPAKPVSPVAVQQHAPITPVARRQSTPITPAPVFTSQMWFEAAKLGDVSMAKKLLAAKINFEITDEYGMTPLMHAAEAGMHEVLVLMLRAHAKTEATTSENITALYLAAAAGEENCVHQLIKYGAHFNVASNVGRTPLFEAALEGREDVVRILLHHHANMEITDMDGRTPLMAAVSKGHTQIVKMLLAAGAQANVVSKRNKNALWYAGVKDDVEMLDILCMSGAHLEQKFGPDQSTLLHHLAKNNQWHAAVTLLEHGASVDAATQEGLTPLWIAVSLGHLEATMVLLHTKMVLLHPKPDLEQAFLQQRLTVLHQAVLKNHFEVAELLVKAGANPETRTLNGKTAIRLAKKSTNPKMVELFQQLDSSLRAQLEREGYEGGENNIPQFAYCSILRDVINHPLTTAPGQTFSLEALEDAFEAKGNPPSIECPITRMPIPISDLSRQQTMSIRSEIEKWATDTIERLKAQKKQPPAAQVSPPPLPSNYHRQGIFAADQNGNDWVDDVPLDNVPDEALRDSCKRQ